MGFGVIVVVSGCLPFGSKQATEREPESSSALKHEEVNQKLRSEVERLQGDISRLQHENAELREDVASRIGWDDWSNVLRGIKASAWWIGVISAGCIIGMIALLTLAEIAKLAYHSARNARRYDVVARLQEERDELERHCETYREHAADLEAELVECKRQFDYQMKQARRKHESELLDLKSEHSAAEVDHKRQIRRLETALIHARKGKGQTVDPEFDV